MCGKTTIEQSVALMKGAVHVYSQDTGLMHIADALSIGLTVFMSARDIEGRWAPKSTTSSYFRARGLNCGYCLCSDCSYDQKCLDIAIDLYLNNIEKV